MLGSFALAEYVARNHPATAIIWQPNDCDVFLTPKPGGGNTGGTYEMQSVVAKVAASVATVLFTRLGLPVSLLSTRAYDDDDTEGDDGESWPECLNHGARATERFFSDYYFDSLMDEDFDERDRPFGVDKYGHRSLINFALPGSGLPRSFFRRDHSEEEPGDRRDSPTV